MLSLSHVGRRRERNMSSRRGLVTFGRIAEEANRVLAVLVAVFSVLHHRACTEASWRYVGIANSKRWRDVRNRPRASIRLIIANIMATAGYEEHCVKSYRARCAGIFAYGASSKQQKCESKIK